MNRDNELELYMNNFFGFGNWNSDIWFVGIEEGGGNSKEEVNLRLESWLNSKKDLLDNYEHHKNIGILQFFDKKVLQPTWRKLIRLKLSYEGITADNDLIRDIQSNNWGLITSDNALLDLFPLPSPSNSKWFYNEWSHLPYLKNRKEYYDFVIDYRVKYIRDKIEKHKPKVIVFYSLSMINYWNKIAEDDLTKNSNKVEIGNSYIRILKKNDTYFVVTPQPASISASSNEFWDMVGLEIRKHNEIKP